MNPPLESIWETTGTAEVLEESTENIELAVVKETEAEITETGIETEITEIETVTTEIIETETTEIVTMNETDAVAALKAPEENQDLPQADLLSLRYH